LTSCGAAAENPDAQERMRFQGCLARLRARLLIVIGGAVAVEPINSPKNIKLIQ
jgi:hypothetical protein